MVMAASAELKVNCVTNRGIKLIYLYSGTPGSGKSYHAVLDIRNKLRRKNRNRVIANFPISRHYDNFEYWDNSDICIAHLFAYAREHQLVENFNSRFIGSALSEPNKTACFVSLPWRQVVCRRWSGRQVAAKARPVRARNSRHRKLYKIKILYN